MAFKMKGYTYPGETPFKRTNKAKAAQDKKEAEKNNNPKDAQGRSQNVNAKDYIIQDVSEVQENEKGKYVTGLNDGSFSNNSTSDTTYIPNNSGYKDGDYLDETDFEEGNLGTGYDFEKKKIKPSSTKPKKKKK